jgi:integrase
MVGVQGSMRRRGDAWELIVYAGRDAVTGKKRYTSRTVRGGKRDAQRALSEMVGAASRGTLAKTNATVGELLEQWFEHATPDLSPATVRETRGYLDRSLLPALGDVSLARLRAQDLDRLYRRLRERGGASGRPLAPGTVRRIHGILHRALAQGVRWGWIGANPASAATPPRVPVSDIRPPSPAEVVRLFDLAHETNPDLATFIVLAAATGARRSELVALRWRDVDLDAGAVRIGRGIVLGPDGPVEKDTKTHQARRVSLDRGASALLSAHRRRCAERALACGASLGAGAFVFSASADGALPWRPDNTTRAFNRLRDRAGLKTVRLHDLRHYVATQLLASGVDIRTVAGRLGHRNASTTLNVYSHFLQSADKDAADALGRIFDDAMAEPKGAR